MRPIARLPSSPSRQRAISTPPPWLATDAAPSDLQALLDQLFGAVTFTANIVLWRQTSYFETTAEMKPLLHILSLEEQYYMLLPAALVLAGRRLRLPLIVAGLVSSFALCVDGVANRDHEEQERAFAQEITPHGVFGIRRSHAFRKLPERLLHIAGLAQSEIGPPNIGSRCGGWRDVGSGHR